MSRTIPLTYRVDYEIGLAAKDLMPASIQEMSAQQSIFYCRCLFYPLRQAAISEPHHPLRLLDVPARSGTHHNDEAVSDAAYSRVEELANLKSNTNKGRHKRARSRRTRALPNS